MVDGWLGRAAQSLTQSVVARGLLAAWIVVSLVLVVRPTVFIAPVLLVSLVPYIMTYRRDAPFARIAGSAFYGFAPGVSLFVLAGVLAFPTAYAPFVHSGLMLKFLALQAIVFAFYCIGRFTGEIDFRATFAWALGILAAATLILVEEQAWFLFRNMTRSAQLHTGGDGWVFNRSFLVVTFALSFLLLAARERGDRWQMLLSSLLLAIIFFFTQSESARLVIVASLLLYLLPDRFMTRLLDVGVGAALLMIVVGPFLYDHLLMAWANGPFGDFMTITFLDRMRIWSDFSALIFDNAYFGRGINSSKILADNRELFAMPHNSYGWHPHNVGLEVITDLGVPGMAWLGLVLLQLRWFIVHRIDCHRHGVIAIALMILMVSFVADGLWQTWWWVALAIIALWFGILSANPPNDPGNRV